MLGEPDHLVEVGWDDGLMVRARLSQAHLCRDARPGSILRFSACQTYTPTPVIAP